MSENRDGLKRIGLGFLYAAAAIFVLAFVACFVIQENLLRLPEITGLIAYFAGPLPVIPAIFATMGMTLLGISKLMK